MSWLQGRLSLVASDRWVELLSGFRRLASLYLNYSWVSDKLLLALSQSTQGKIKLLSVKVTLSMVTGNISRHSLQKLWIGFNLTLFPNRATPFY